jgi:hypothetical protein
MQEVRGLLPEAKVDDSLYVVVTVDLRDVLERTLSWEV